MKKKMSLREYLGGLTKKKQDEAALAQAQTQTTETSTEHADENNVIEVDESTKCGSEEIIDEVDMPLAPPVSDDIAMSDDGKAEGATTTSASTS